MKPIDTGSEFVPEAWVDGTTVYCKLAGDLNVQTVAWARVVFARLIADYKPKKLVVDLEPVGFIDSAGLAALVLARKQLGDGVVTLANAAAPVCGLLKIAQLDKLFSFDPL